MTTGTERSSVLGGRREETACSEHVAVEHSKPVRQPLGMTDHRESNDAWMVPVGLTSRLMALVEDTKLSVGPFSMTKPNPTDKYGCNATQSNPTQRNTQLGLSL